LSGEIVHADLTSAGTQVSDNHQACRRSLWPPPRRNALNARPPASLGFASAEAKAIHGTRTKGTLLRRVYIGADVSVQKHFCSQIFLDWQQSRCYTRLILSLRRRSSPRGRFLSTVPSRPVSGRFLLSLRRVQSSAKHMVSPHLEGTMSPEVLAFFLNAKGNNPGGSCVLCIPGP
jgi:hypothetical protein